MSRIFLSYRRQDSAGAAGRIYDRLRAHFGDDAIFMDIDAIPFGLDFREHIRSALDDCGVVLAVIGRRWAGETGAPRRIDDPRDFVRIEIESALERNLPVIPILIDRAQMPGEADLPPSLARLAYRNAIDLDQGRDFHHHVDRLIKGIERLLRQPNRATAAPPGRQPENRPASIPAAKKQEQARKPARVDASQRPRPAPTGEPQPGRSPSPADPGRGPKHQLPGADSSKSEVQAMPGGAVQSEPLSRAIPAGSRSPGPAVSSQLPGTPPKRRNVPWLWVYLTVLPLLAGLGIVVHIVTDTGTVKISGSDPNMVVRIDGREIRIENLGEPITLRTGAHDLLVTRGDLVVTTQTFQIHRGQETPLEVTYIPRPSLTEQGGGKKAESPSPSVAGESKPTTSTTHVPSPKSVPPSRNTQPPSPQPTREWTNSIGIKLALIPAGTFPMGSTDADKNAADDEKPQHEVRITRPFYLGVHEVTQGQYLAVMGQSPSSFKGSEDLPVEQVSWLDAVRFGNKLSEREGRTPYYRIQGDAVTIAGGDGYCLPTEAEWEYACRAGSKTRFSFGDDENALGQYAWYSANSNGQTHAVGEKKPNAFGLYDMYGNVWEWYWDGYDADYYKQSSADDPRGPGAAARRVLRGGSWSNDPRYARSACRDRGTPEGRNLTLGIRLARGQSGR